MLAEKLQAQVRRVFGAKLKASSGDAPSDDDEPADASHRGDDLERCCEFRLAADDERRFERLLRRRVAHEPIFWPRFARPKWFLLFFNYFLTSYTHV